MKKLFCTVFLFSIVLFTTGAGYVGTLPDVDGEFSYLRKDISEKSSAPFSVRELDKQNEAQLNPIPRRNENYVDIIIKKDKTSRYANDMNSVIIILEKLRKCMNTDNDIQKFNAIISNLIDNTAYIREEYKDKPESNYLSYGRIYELSKLAGDTAKFRMNGQTAEKYIPCSSPDNIYTKENLNKKLETLYADVNETIFILKNLE